MGNLISRSERDSKASHRRRVKDIWEIFPMTNFAKNFLERKFFTRTARGVQSPKTAERRASCGAFLIFLHICGFMSDTQSRSCRCPTNNSLCSAGLFLKLFRICERRCWRPSFFMPINVRAALYNAPQASYATRGGGKIIDTVFFPPKTQTPLHAVIRRRRRTTACVPYRQIPSPPICVRIKCLTGTHAIFTGGKEIA